MEQPYVQQNVPYYEQQVPISSDEIYANVMQEDRIKNIIAQISPENQIEEIEMRIRGYRKDPVSGMWVKIENAIDPPPQLVGKFVSYLSAIMNQATTLGNISTIQVNKIMKMVIEWIVDDIEANAEEYELEDNYTERTRIAHIVLNNVFFTLTRAINGTESRRMWSSLSLAESTNPYGAQQQKSEWWKFWKK